MLKLNKIGKFFCYNNILNKLLKTSIAVSLVMFQAVFLFYLISPYLYSANAQNDITTTTTAKNTNIDKTTLNQDKDVDDGINIETDNTVATEEEDTNTDETIINNNTNIEINFIESFPIIIANNKIQGMENVPISRKELETIPNAVCR